jgi:hypothetical protein
MQGRTQKKISGGFEKIRIITVRPEFENLAPSGVLFMPLPRKKINNNNITLIISTIIEIL